MKNRKITTAAFKSLYPYVITATLVWTAIIAISLTWNYIYTLRDMKESARNMAQMVCNKDIAFHYWATKHGGVYMPLTKETQPNKYLANIPERDIALPSGEKLTLMDPTSMLKQIMEKYPKLYGVGGHITSLKPLNPGNVPDAWERRALYRFNNGSKEVIEFMPPSKGDQLRFMRPIFTKKGCLKCHGKQGYKTGDIQGGVSVFINMRPYQNLFWLDIKYLFVTHGLIWLFGLVAIGFIFQRTKKRIIEYMIADEELRKYKHIISATNDHMSFLDQNYTYLAVNAAFLKAHRKTRRDIIGLSVAELLGKKVFDQKIRKKLDHCMSGENVRYQGWFDFAGLGRRHMDMAYYPFRDIDESISGIIISAHDTTDQKQKEELILAQKKLGWVLNTDVGLEDALRLCLETAIQVSGMDCGWVHLMDDNSNVLELIIHRGLLPDFVKSVAHYDTGSDRMRLVMAGKPIYMNCQAPAALIDDFCRKEGLLAIAIIPVLYDNHVIACFSIGSHKFDNITDSARATLETIAIQIGNSISRKKTEAQLQRYQEHLEELVRERTGELAQSLDEMTKQRVSIQNMALDLEETNKALVEEIEERRQTEEELRKLSKAIQQSPASVVITDIQGNIEYVNPKFSQLTGYTLEESLNENPRILKSGGMPAEIYKELWETISSGKQWRGELQNKKKNGDLYWESASISPIKNQEGVITHFVAVKEDITERKQAEIELNHARQRAEAASRAKSEFLANMSHEIRTPMNGVVGMAHLLEDTKLDHSQRHYVKSIQQSADLLLHLINDILDLSKIEAGKLNMEAINFDIIAMLEETSNLLAIRAHQKRLEYICLIDPDIPVFVSGDPGRIRQVLFNIVGNAIKFTDKGKIQIHVSRVQTDNPENNRDITLMFQVIDTGIGIPEEAIEILFVPFSQADASMTRKFGGTGLGLAICKQLVGMMGGAISISSKKGKGSTFTFSVVLGMVSPEERAIVESKQKPVPIDTRQVLLDARKHRVKILVAEDFPINQEIILRLLKKFNYSADIVGNGHEAILALENYYYDLVLMDIQMPVIDGIEACRVIRDPKSNVLDHDVPIIALTAHAMRGDRQKYLDTGMNDYLSKPIDPDALHDVVIRNLPDKYQADKNNRTKPPADQIRVVPPKESVDTPGRRLFDKTELLNRVRGDNALYTKLLNMFFNIMPQEIKALKKEIADKDIEKIRQSAHKLKGSCANISAHTLSDLALEMETAAKNSDLEKSGRIFETLEAEFKRFCTAHRRAASLDRL